MKLALLQGNRFTPWHLPAFARLDGSPEVVAFRAESEIQAHFRDQGADTLPFPIEPIYFDTQAGPWLQRVKNRCLARFRGREPRLLPFHERLEGFDLIQSWELFTDWSAEAVQARKRWDVPLSVMVWDNIPFNMERKPYRRAIKQAVAQHADRFLVHTERSWRTLRLEGVDEARIVKIDPGVDTKLFAPGPGTREAFGLARDEFVILFVGWLLPRKGIDFLVLALREILRDPALDRYRVRLLLAGAEPGRARVEALIARLGVGDRCVFTGPVPYKEMPRLFRAADAFVLPSIATEEWQEQFGMALIEAMACGVPVVTTLSGAIPEMVGDAGVLCQPNDFVSLYDAITALMRDDPKRRALAEAGRARAVARFELGRYAADLSRVYREMGVR